MTGSRRVRRILLVSSAALITAAAALPTAATQPPSRHGTATDAPLEARSAVTLPPRDRRFDYQIGGDYRPPKGVRIVSRDWFAGKPLAGAYNICYINAFQTQPDEAGVDRPDERANWPPELVLSQLGDDPEWGGEYLIDISSATKREKAAAWVAPMIETCRDKGFDAVEFDNLDSWTRFKGTPVRDRVPFGRRDAVAHAALLADAAHAAGLAAAQKNTAQLSRAASRHQIGFDFAIAEECGRWRECGRYRRVFGARVLVIEYRRVAFRRTCRKHGRALSVVLRDRNASRPGAKRYRYRSC